MSSTSASRWPRAAALQSPPADEGDIPGIRGSGLMDDDQALRQERDTLLVAHLWADASTFGPDGLGARWRLPEAQLSAPKSR